jgi:hypothetical protein
MISGLTHAAGAVACLAIFAGPFMISRRGLFASLANALALCALAAIIIRTIA